MSKLKVCNTCKKKRRISSYYKDKRAKDGHWASCRDCAYLAARKWHVKHPGYEKRYLNKNPWQKTLNGIRARCSNPNAENYARYGGRGVKNFLTATDLKYLWFRDKASSMKKPSINRKNSNKHYTRKNCCYIEFSDNCKQANFCLHCKGPCKLRKHL